MHSWWRWILVIAVSRLVLSASRTGLEHPNTVQQPLDTFTGQARTGNLIFQSVSSFLQQWPNTKYVNGHTIASASIAPGTVLYHVYHSRFGGNPTLDKPDWLATDPEHSYVFCHEVCNLLSFVTTRKLRLAYFDGSSAAKLTSGTMDSQDIMIWGQVKEDMARSDSERIVEACKWGKQYGLDGFVRMEMDFEVMACSFSDGLQLVSNSTIMTTLRENSRHFGADHEAFLADDRHFLLPPPHSPPGGLDRESALGPGDPGRGPSRDLPEPVIPEGWKGSMRSRISAIFEAIHSGSWHNHVPGETRVHIDYSRLVSFFDPALTSLAASRANQNRSEYRILGISSEDAKDVRDQLVDIFTREGQGSGIDWRSIVHVIIERYSARLKLVQHLLEPPTTRNITEQAAQVRAQVLIMLTPYMLTAAIPLNNATEDRSWIIPITNHCASTLTSWTPVDPLTRQEKVVKNAINEVLHEICRVIGDIWVDAFGVEGAPVEDTQSFLNKWSSDIDGLMSWLDWSVWDTCKPACGPEERCYISTWPWLGNWRGGGGGEKVDMTPRCISLLEPDDLARAL